MFYGMSSETHLLSLHHFSRWAHCTTNQYYVSHYYLIIIHIKPYKTIYLYIYIHIKAMVKTMVVAPPTSYPILSTTGFSESVCWFPGNRTRSENSPLLMVIE